MMSDKRTLVCVIAETRAHKITWPSIKKNLLDELNADLALCISTPDAYDYENPFWQEAKYKWTVPEYDDWGQAFDFAQNEIRQDGDMTVVPNWRRILLIKDQWLGGIKGEDKHPGSAGILIYFRWHLLQKLRIEGLLDKYDRFIITRSDFVWLNPHPPLELLDREKIWIPDGEAYGGVTDRHAVLSSKHLVPYLNIADPILVHTDRLFNEMKHYSEWNLEKFIYFMLGAQGLAEDINYFPYCMYSVRAREGSTSWTRGVWSDELGYYIKYPEEYASSIAVQKALKDYRGWAVIMNEHSGFRFNAALQVGDRFFVVNEAGQSKISTSSEYLQSAKVLHVDCGATSSHIFLASPGLGNNSVPTSKEDVIMQSVSENMYYIKSVHQNLYYAVNSAGFLELNLSPFVFIVRNRYKGVPRRNWVPCH